MSKNSKKKSDPAPNFDPPNTLRLSIDHNEANSSASIKWSVMAKELDVDDIPDFEIYNISMGSLYGHALIMRDVLNRMQEKTYLDENEVLKPGSISDLHAIASTGAEMFKVVTTGRTGYPDDEENAAHFLKWFREVVEPEPHGKWRIQVEHKNFAGQTFPWGLIFSPNSDKNIDELGDSFDDYTGFWCLKYFLACSGPAQHLFARDLAPARRFHLSAIIEDEDETRREIVEHGNIEIDEDDIRKHMPRSKHDIRNIWKGSEEADQFWYINLQSKDNSPVYTVAETRLDSKNIGDSILRDVQDSDDSDRKVGFLLFDGDAVVRGDRGSEWIETILGMVNVGLIAAETDINNPSLKFFGWDLLAEILVTSSPSGVDKKDEQSFLSATYNARKKLWPHGLLYGMYCNPHHIFASPPPKAIKNITEYLNVLKKQEISK